MIDAFQLYTDLCATVNTQQGGLIRPNQTFMQWVRDIEMELFTEGKLQFEASQLLSDELTPFLRSMPVQVRNAPNENFDVAVLPPDYDYFCSARLKTPGEESGMQHDYSFDEDEQTAWQILADANISTTRVTKVTNNRWNAILQRHTLRPSLARPKCTQFDGGLKIAPKGIGIIQLDYLRKPEEGKLVYTITNAGTEEEYYLVDKSRSKPLEWDESMKPVFIKRLKAKYLEARARQ